MLMNTVKSLYQDILHGVDVVQPIVATPGMCKAANANGFGQSELQSRRQRRQRREERAGQHGGLGWRVSAW